MSLQAIALAIGGAGLWLVSRGKKAEPSAFAAPTQAPGFVEAVAAYDALTAFTSSRAYSAEERARVDAALETLRLALIRPPALPAVPTVALPVAVST